MSTISRALWRVYSIIVSSHNLPDADNTVIAEEKNHIFDMMQASQQPPFLPPIQAHDERLSGFDFSMGRNLCRDYSLLVNL